MSDIRSEIEKIDEVQGSNPLITTWQNRVQIIVPLSNDNDAFVKAGYGYPGIRSNNYSASCGSQWSSNDPKYDREFEHERPVYLHGF